MKAKEGEENVHIKGLPGSENQKPHCVRGSPQLATAWHVITEQNSGENKEGTHPEEQAAKSVSRRGGPALNIGAGQKGQPHRVDGVHPTGASTSRGVGVRARI